MPEKFSIEPSLEQAFDTLTTEVGERTSSPGAAAAISAARRRRTTMAAAVAVALIAVGGATFSQLGGGSDRVSPADELPAPALLDAAALNALTEGWVSGWHEAGKADEEVLLASGDLFQCLDNSSAGETADVDPRRFGSSLMVGGAGQLANVVFADFGSDAAAATAALGEIEPALASCAGDGGVTETYGDQARVTTYSLPADGPATETVWVARLDNRVSFAMLLADGSPTAAQRRALGAALLGALQEDQSYRLGDAQQIEGSGSATAKPPVSASTESAAPVQTIDLDSLAAALAGWSTWQETGDIKAAPALPCLTGPTTSSSGSGESVGTTAELSVYDFDSEQAALQGMQQVLGMLAACSDGPWDLDSTTAPNAVIGSHPEGTVWVVRQGSRVATFTIGGATSPPRAVRLAVAELVRNAL